MQHLVKLRNYLEDHGWEIPKKLDKNTRRGTGMLANKVLVAPPEWHTFTQTRRDSDRHSCRLQLLLHTPSMDQSNAGKADRAAPSSVTGPFLPQQPGASQTRPSDKI